MALRLGVPCAAELRPAEVRLEEVHPAEVRPDEVRLLRLAAMRSTPLRSGLSPEICSCFMSAIAKFAHHTRPLNRFQAVSLDAPKAILGKGLPCHHPPREVLS